MPKDDTRPQSVKAVPKIPRIPPHNTDMENAVLACLMLGPKSMDKIYDMIKPEDFYEHKNELIFSIILKLYETNEPYDYTMVVSALRSASLLAEAGGEDYLISLTHIVPNAANINSYAHAVKEKSLLRSILDISALIAEKVGEYDQDVTLEAISAVDECSQMISDLSRGISRYDPIPIYDILNSTYQKLEERYNNSGRLSGISTGFIDLDRMTDGFQPSNLIVIAARPGMGKTALAVNIAQNAAAIGKSVAVFSLEMSADQLVMRMISGEAEIDSSKLRDGKFDPKDWELLAHHSAKLSALKIYIDDSSISEVVDIRSKCRRLKMNKALDMLIVDYIQLLGNNNTRLNRNEEMSRISRALKSLAKELDIPVIALSQLSREVEKRTNKRPQLSDLRDSGAIEQDADVIIFIYRQEYYDKKDGNFLDDKNKGVAEIMISKHRSGSTGTLRLTYIDKYTKFYNLASESIY
jgi:replicative DNA helicase